MTKKLTEAQEKLIRNRKRDLSHTITNISFSANSVICSCAVQTTVDGYVNHKRETKGLPPMISRQVPKGLAWGLTGLILRDYDYE